MEKMTPPNPIEWFHRILIVCSLFLCTGVVSYDKNDWYRKYGNNYPDYCSTTDQMSNRGIPKFPADDNRIGETRLVHVSAVIRHGARTPVDGSDCWVGYYQLPETGVWNCPLTTFASPPNAGDMAFIGGSVFNSGEPRPIDEINFELKYDAMMHSSSGLSNKLNGTCEYGQLLLQGYDQQLTNGKALREAYVYDSSNHGHDIRMRLLDVSDKAEQHFWHESNVHFRSDDDQRTKLSGEVLLTGLFEKEIADYYQHARVGSHINIPIHLADRSRDILDANVEVCPRLAEIRSKIESSKEFQSFNSSKEAKLLFDFKKNELGRSDKEMSAIDCLMTTMCTDRPLPDSIIESGLDVNQEPKQNSNYGSHILDRLLKFQYRRDFFRFKANDAEFSKLAMGPLWAEIMENVEPVVNGEDPPVKFALYSGHDLTIMPLLATLGPKVFEDGTFPPYASMVLIEIHEHIDGQTDRETFRSKFTFRLIYNGEVITNRISQCPEDSELCDATILLNIVQPFAKRDRDCSVSKKFAKQKEHGNSISSSGSAQFFTFLLTLLFGAAFGAVGAFVHVKGRFPAFSGSSRSSGQVGSPSSSPKPYYGDDDIDGLMLTDNPFRDNPIGSNEDDNDEKILE